MSPVCLKCGLNLAQVSLVNPFRWRCVNARCSMYYKNVERTA